MTDLEKTLFDLCAPLVDDEKSLSVKTMSSSNENEISLYVARLIGRKGVMASALRQMMSIASRNEDKHIAVKFEAY